MDFAGARAAIYDCIRGQLATAAIGQTSSHVIEQLLITAQGAACDALADFAESWNRESTGSGAERLPAELLAMCLRTAPFDVLVSASHVSRRWRAVLIGDGSLWASFLHVGRSGSSVRNDERMLGQLAVMLDRSRPYPFSLQLPHPELGYRRYAGNLKTLLLSDFSRMRHYDGPFDLYERLGGYDTPMPHLRSLRLVSPMHSSPRAVFRVPEDWATRIASNIHRLDLENLALGITHNIQPMRSLTQLKLPAEYQPDYEHLFQCCPNLVSLDLYDLVNKSILPHGPLPMSLIAVSLYARKGGGTEFGLPLKAWSAYPVPNLTVFGAFSVARPLGHFISLCPTSTLQIDVTGSRVEIAEATPDAAPVPSSQSRCLVYPYSWAHGNQLRALAGDCAARLASLTVSIAHFGALFDAQLDAPQLVRLAFTLGPGRSGDAVRGHSVPPMPPSAALWLFAPRLRELVVFLPRDPFLMAGDTVCAAAADALRLHLRALVRFDAQRLQSVTVHGAQDIIAVLGCAGLAQYALEYLEEYGPAA